MANIVVADTGPLVTFTTLELFSLFPHVLDTVPEVVMSEIYIDPSRSDVSCIQSAIDKQWLKIEQITLLVKNDFPTSFE